MPFSYTEPFSFLAKNGVDQWKYSVGASVAGQLAGYGLHYDVFRYQLVDNQGAEIGNKTDQVVRLAAGTDIAGLVTGRNGRFHCGVGTAAKLLHGSVSENTILLGGGSSGTTIDFDVGTALLYVLRGASASDSTPRASSAPYAAVRAGIVVRNVFDRGIQFAEDGATLPIGGGLATAVAFEYAPFPHSRVGQLLRGNVSWQGDWHRQYQKLASGAYDSAFFEYTDPIHRIGAELILFDHVAVRGGHVDDNDLDLRAWCWGLGVAGSVLRSLGVVVNYARVPGQEFQGEERVDHFEVSGRIEY